MALLDNYERETGRAEVVTKQEEAENRRFIDSIVHSGPIKIAHKFLVSKRLAPPEELPFKKMLYNLWFKMYGRTRGCGRWVIGSIYTIWRIICFLYCLFCLFVVVVGFFVVGGGGGGWGGWKDFQFQCCKCSQYGYSDHWFVKKLIWVMEHHEKKSIADVSSPLSERMKIGCPNTPITLPSQSSKLSNISVLHEVSSATCNWNPMDLWPIDVGDFLQHLGCKILLDSSTCSLEKPRIRKRWSGSTTGSSSTSRRRLAMLITMAFFPTGG